MCAWQRGGGHVWWWWGWRVGDVHGGMHGKGGVCVWWGACMAREGRDGHCSGRYASYWNAFLFYSVCGQVIVIFFFVSDVHSYAEDEMVEDPWLTKHLAHFGINITQLEKVK